MAYKIWMYVSVRQRYYILLEMPTFCTLLFYKKCEFAISFLLWLVMFNVSFSKFSGVLAFILIVWFLMYSWTF